MKTKRRAAIAAAVVVLSFVTASQLSRRSSALARFFSTTPEATGERWPSTGHDLSRLDGHRGEGRTISAGRGHSAEGAAASRAGTAVSGASLDLGRLHGKLPAVFGERALSMSRGLGGAAGSLSTTNGKGIGASLRAGAADSGRVAAPTAGLVGRNGGSGARVDGSAAASGLASAAGAKAKSSNGEMPSTAKTGTSGTAGVGGTTASGSPADLSRLPVRFVAPAQASARTSGGGGAVATAAAPGGNAPAGGSAKATGPERVVTQEITVSVFGPWGPDGPKKMVQTNRHTGLFEPQPHNPTPNLGLQEQVYRLVAAGREQPKTNPQPITLASGATMHVDNWNVQVPHRPNIQIAGAQPIEYGTIPIYARQAFDNSQDPNRLSFQVPTVTAPTRALFFCSIHPTEVRAELLLLPANVQEQLKQAPRQRGGSHGGGNAALRDASPATLLSDSFRDFARGVTLAILD